MAKIYLKDKKDFNKHYNDDDADLKGYIFWRDSIIQDKVEVKIAIFTEFKRIKKELNKIKD